MGFAPTYEWRPNADGAVRTIAAACELARRWGVAIPEYVHFALDKSGKLDKKTTAKTTTFKEPAGTIIYWSWLFHKKTGKIPFLIRKDIMASDEAIVAVIGHEMYELEQLREIFEEGAPIEQWIAETHEHNYGNAHWDAWEYGDQLVAKMRRLSDG